MTTSYKIIWRNSAAKELKKIEKKTIQKIIDRVLNLSTNPQPADCKKIQGSEHTYRIRVGNYRVIYSVLNQILTIEILRVRHRKDVYR